MADRHCWLDGCCRTQPHSGLWGLLAFYLCLYFHLCWTAAAAFNLTLVYGVCWLFIFVYLFIFVGPLLPQSTSLWSMGFVDFLSLSKIMALLRYMCLLQVLLSKLIFHIPPDTAKYKAHPLRFLKVASCIYQVYHADLSGSLGKLNLSLNRTAWALGLAWMTAACVNGYGGPVDWVIFTV